MLTRMGQHENITAPATEMTDLVILHPHKRKESAAKHWPTRFQVAVYISRTPRSDGANDGAQVRATSVLSSYNLEPYRTQASTNRFQHTNTL